MLEIRNIYFSNYFCLVSACRRPNLFFYQTMPKIMKLCWLKLRTYPSRQVISEYHTYVMVIRTLLGHCITFHYRANSSKMWHNTLASQKFALTHSRLQETPLVQLYIVIISPTLTALVIVFVSAFSMLKCYIYFIEDLLGR